MNATADKLIMFAKSQKMTKEEWMEAIDHLYAAQVDMQLESNAGCEEITISLNTGWSAGNEILRSALILLKDFFFMLAKNAGVEIRENGTVTLRIPRSISYESMGQEEYEEVALIICRHLSEVYWSGLGTVQIAEMAESMVDE